MLLCQVQELQNKANTEVKSQKKGIETSVELILQQQSDFMVAVEALDKDMIHFAVKMAQSKQYRNPQSISFNFFCLLFVRRGSRKGKRQKASQIWKMIVGSPV